jgi:hypothetical protein
MSFRLVPFHDARCTTDCLQIIEAKGEIRFDSAEGFLAFARNLPGRVSATLIVDSPGGNLGGAIKLGFVLRRLGATVIVGRVGESATRIWGGSCASACPFLLMGGRRRYVPDGSRVGVHAMADIPGQRDLDGPGTIAPKVSNDQAAGVLRSYVRSMGVDPRIVALAQGTPHDSIRVLSPAEIARFRLASRGLPR